MGRYQLGKEAVGAAMQPIEAWFYDVPIVTRTYVALVLITTVAIELNIVSALHLYFNLDAILDGQVWRIVTAFLYFGDLNINFMLHLYFLSRNARMLEEGSFRGRTADYVFFFLFGAVMMLMVAPFTHVMFMGQALDMMLMYVWGRRNSSTHMRLLYVFQFTAAYLPWVVLFVPLLFGQKIQNMIVDIIGIGVGHIYFFLEDVYPANNNGYKPLKTPKLLKTLIDGPEPETEEYQVPGGGAPGGFNWGREE